MELLGLWDYWAMVVLMMIGFYAMIGKRNYVTLRKIFWKNGILIDAEDVGGSISRTLRLEVSNGRVTVKNRNGEVEL